MGNFIPAKLRTPTQEQPLKKALRTVPPTRGQSTVIYVFQTAGSTSNNVLLVVHTI